MSKKKNQFHRLAKEIRADRRRQAFRLLDEGQDKEYVAKFSEAHVKTIEHWMRNRDKLEKNNYHGLKRGNPNDQRGPVAKLYF